MKKRGVNQAFRCHFGLYLGAAQGPCVCMVWESGFRGLGTGHLSENFPAVLPSKRGGSDI